MVERQELAEGLPCSKPTDLFGEVLDWSYKAWSLEEHLGPFRGRSRAAPRLPTDIFFASLTGLWTRPLLVISRWA